MPSSPKPHCSEPLCSGFAEVGSKCSKHAKDKERRRGTSRERGYATKRWGQARRATLIRDRWCKCCKHCCPDGCTSLSQVADHFPESRKELINRGVTDPDDPKYLRGLSKSCHSRETNFHQAAWRND